ncbi:MAG: sulfite exporter TauE/SafE family protein [Cyanobacteria bacterium P01_E01_bin.34]
MFDLLLIAVLGFLGSFGHCVAMCGPLAVAFSLSAKGETGWQRQLVFHSLLNVGRIFSYLMVGAVIGAVSSVAIAGGQIAGLGSLLRRLMAVVTGLALVWIGLRQLYPQLLPTLPFLHPFVGGLHDRLNRVMTRASDRYRWWTPALLGSIWGLIPCGFLYVAQIKAAETGNLWLGAATMLAFGLGTVPAMLAIGVSASRLSSDRRSQLFRLGGWLTLVIGILTLMRAGESTGDYAAYSAVVCLVLALVARPLHRIWPSILSYRRAIGVGAFVLSAAHGLHVLVHAWDWNVQAVAFMLPSHQFSIGLGVGAIALMLPAAATSFNWAQKRLGSAWRKLHLLSVPALILCAGHAIAIGPQFLGSSQLGWGNWCCTGGLIVVVVAVLLARSRWCWSMFALEKRYVPPQNKLRPIGQNGAETGDGSVNGRNGARERIDRR